MSSKRRVRPELESRRMAANQKQPLSITHPEVAAQAHGWDPSTVYAGSHQKREWSCTNGHITISEVRTRAIRGLGCPICGGKSVLPGFNDVLTTYPEIARQAHGWDPTTLTAGSSEKRAWKCTWGHVWQATVADRSGQKTGCPICAGKSVLAGFNDLATTHPDIAAQAHEWDPTTLTAGTDKKRSWICEKHHVWNATVVSRTYGSGCPVCSGKAVLVGYNDLATTHPDIAAQAHEWDPTTLTAGSNKKREWICNLGHIWGAAPGGRTRRGDGCPICAGRTVLVGFNDLATTMPDLAEQAHGWDPMTLTAGSDARRGWRCFAGHTWQANVSSRAGGRGCPTCANGGYDPNQEGWVYLLRRQRDGLLQIGITNVPAKRLSTHARSGWEPLDLLGPIDGQTARDLEQSILRLLGSMGVPRANTFASPFEGYSEAWRTCDLEVFSIRELRELLRDSDQS